VNGFPTTALRDLAPLLQREAEQADKNSRLTVAAAEALRDAGVFRLGVPKSFGGYEVGLATAVDVVAEIATTCPSSAWITAIFYVGQQLVGGYDEDVRKEVWSGDPDATVCGAFHGIDVVAVPAEGGQIVSGRYPAASGSHQATWGTIGTPIVGPDGTVVGHGVALLPMAELTVVDTWDPLGMRGTGSNTLVADNVFVPANRIRSFPDALSGTTTATEPLYRISSAPMLLASAAPMLGTARELFERTLEFLSKPMTEANYARTADAPGTHSALAEAATLIDSADLHLSRSARLVDEAAVTPHQLPYPQRARLRMDVAHAVQCLRRAGELLISIAGPGSLATGKVTQRFWRDLEAGSRHPYFNDGVAREIYGRVLAGLEQHVTPLV
jgi:alkylation response protein AidB-like acyl-CoA dehydrogenase